MTVTRTVPGLGAPATMSALGHALAGALISARGSIEAAAGRYPGDEDVEAAARSVARANTIVGAVTRMSGAARAPESAPVSLDDALRTALRRVRALTEAPEVQASPLPEVLADEEHVINLLCELLTNVARHAGPGARVVISGGEAGPGAARVLLADDGPGLPAGVDATHPAYFRPGNGTGAGCGLALARDLAEVNGGTLTLSSGPEGGLTAELTLPTAAG